MVTVRDAALAAHRAGISVLPPKEDGSKAPDANEWKVRQQRLATQAELDAYYGSRAGVGWVCGRVSGNLETLEFDDARAYISYKAAAERSGLGDLVARIEAGYLEESPAGGFHWPYRCSQISGNTKLARRQRRPEEMLHANDKIKVLIETRGEGGYIITAPTNGKVHPTGGAYRLISGSPETIVTITPEERDDLFALARLFDQMPKSQFREPKAAGDGWILRPGDDFNQRAEWADVLEPHGWAIAHSKGEVDFWVRPGKQRGWSATTNYAGCALLYVFSTSTEFDSERGYSKFGAYTVLNHSCDFTEATKTLLAQGYGKKAESTTNSRVRTESGHTVDTATGEVLEDADTGAHPLLAAIPPYPLEALPKVILQFVDAHTSGGLPAPLLGAAAIGAIATAIGPNVMCQAWDGWIERVILWIVLMGPATSGKSPSQDKAYDFLRTHDAAEHEKYLQEIAAWIADKRRGDPPWNRSVLCDDTNLEALARRLNVSPGGAAGLDMDELAVLLRGLGEYKKGGGGDRGRFLKLWQGASWAYQRVGSGGLVNAIDILIPRPTVTICGALQTYLHPLLGGEQDGQRSRWLLHLVGDDAVADVGDEHVGAPTPGSWDELLQKLLDCRLTKRAWVMSDEARRVFIAQRREWKLEARSEGVNASTAAALQKADKQLVRLTPVLAEACAPGAGGDISLQVLNRGRALINYNIDCWRALTDDAPLSLSRRDEVLDAAIGKLIECLDRHGGQATVGQLQSARPAGARTKGDLGALLDRYEASFPGSIVVTGTTGKGGRPGRIVRAPRRAEAPVRTYHGGFADTVSKPDTFSREQTAKTDESEKSQIETPLGEGQDGQDEAVSKPPQGGSKPPQGDSKPPQGGGFADSNPPAVCSACETRELLPHELAHGTCSVCKSKADGMWWSDDDAATFEEDEEARP